MDEVRLMPCRRNPARAKGQVIAQTVRSCLSSARPDHGTLVAKQALVVASRLDAPAHGDAVEVGDESACLGVAEVAARGLDSESVCSLLDRRRPENTEPVWTFG